MTDPDLMSRAERLWPHSPTLQQRWIAAVILVRSTKRGWVCDVGGRRA